MVPAPSGLAVVQDFLNTRSRADRDDDLLATVRAAQAWAAGAVRAWSRESGAAVAGIRLTSADLPPLRELRLALSEAAARFADVPLAAGTDRSGRVVLAPAAGGWRSLAGILAIEMFRAQQADRWRRLKTCRNPACPVAFYDRSPNNAGVWHDVRVCGNVANLRASRARRRVSPPAADASRTATRSSG